MKFRILTSTTFLSVLLLVLATVTGCTTVDQKITLRYTPFSQTFGQHSGEVIVARDDSAPRAKNSKGEWVIGALNNVHGVHQADLLADRNLGDWISDALLLELKHAGYMAIQKPAIPENVPGGVQISDITVSINVNKDIVKADITQELKFNVNLYLNGVRSKTFSVSSRNNQTLAWTASAEENEYIMFHSLQDAMKQVIPEIIAMFDKK